MDAPEQAFRDAAVACLDALYGFALALCHDREVIVLRPVALPAATGGGR